MTADWVVPHPLPGRAWSSQNWLDLSFLHWPVQPSAVEALFPPGTRPDVIDGVTYVGLIAFRMSRAGIGPELPVPYLGDFLETNVRLYSVDDQGHHGVLFLSLETERLAVAVASRATVGIPYTWAKMRSTHHDDIVSYESTRRWPQRGLHTQLSMRIGPAVRPTDVEIWLTARWGAHSRVAGRTLWTPNIHPAWPVHEATLLSLDDGLVAGAGVSLGDAPMLRPLWSPGVRTTFGAPTAL
jgi:uncharacterized protein YqjF (DUF2071 family)